MVKAYLSIYSRTNAFNITVVYPVLLHTAQINSSTNHSNLNIAFTNCVLTAEVPIPGISGIPGIPSQYHRQAHIVHFAFAETAGASGIHFPANTEIMENNEH